MRLAMALAALSIVGCSSNIKATKSVRSSGAIMNSLFPMALAAASDLPECNEVASGMLVYAQLEQKFFVCSNLAWQDIEVSGPKGEKGDKGEQGVAGTKGEPGKNGSGGSVLDDIASINSGSLSLMPTSGKVGIGTTAPDATLSIADTAGENLYITRHTDNAMGANIKFRKARGSPSTPASLVDGDQISYIQSGGYVRNSADTAAEFVPLTSIISTVDGLDGQGRAGGAIRFYTSTGGSATGTEKLRVSSNGNVGLGVTNPFYGRLHVNVGTDQNFIFRSGGPSPTARIEATNDAVSQNVPMEFVATDFTFVGGGKVGIGTDVPQAMLDVTQTSTIASGDHTGMLLETTYNQVASTADNTDLLIKRNETAVGSGNQFMMQSVVNGYSVFEAERDGFLAVKNQNGGYIQINPYDGSIDLSSGNDIATYIDFKGSGNLASDWQGRIGYEDGFGMRMFTNASLTSSIFISDAGNVGIGSNNVPQRTLHISGVARLEPQGAAPGSPEHGDLYTHTNGALCFFNGASWDQLNATGSCP